MEYRVTWTIELDAKNAQDAAEQALAIQRRPDSSATFFTCEADGTAPVEIDLTPYRKAIS